MKKRKIPILIHMLWMVNFVFISGSFLLAQEEIHIKTENVEMSLKAGDEVVIETVSGDEITGTVTGYTDENLLLASKYGELKLNFGIIKEINIIRKMGDTSGETNWRFRDPLSTRSFFSATGQTLQKGEKSFENYYLFFNAFNYGITNNLQINAGMSLFFFK